MIRHFESGIGHSNRAVSVNFHFHHWMNLARGATGADAFSGFRFAKLFHGIVSKPKPL
jgi:hypothetical protein